MDKNTKRVTLDVVDAMPALREAHEAGAHLEILQESGPAGVPYCSLYGPRPVVNALLTKWSYDEQGR